MFISNTGMNCVFKQMKKRGQNYPEDSIGLGRYAHARVCVYICIPLRKQCCYTVVSILCQCFGMYNRQNYL